MRMFPAFLVPETTISDGGVSSPLDLGPAERSSKLLLTLGITHVIEQESLVMRIEGSTDGDTWTGPPLITLPEKFYTGVSAVIIDFVAYPGIRFIRAHWKVDRWGRGTKLPLFRIYLAVEEVKT